MFAYSQGPAPAFVILQATKAGTGPRKEAGTGPGHEAGTGPGNKVGTGPGN